MHLSKGERWACFDTERLDRRYNNQQCRTIGGTTPCCNMGNITDNMVAIFHWHPSRVNTDITEGTHKPDFQPSSTPCHLFCVSLVLSWLNSSRQDGPCGRAPTLFPSLIPPPPPPLRHMQPPRRYCRHAPVWGDSLSLIHKLDLGPSLGIYTISWKNKYSLCCSTSLMQMLC